ncbi:papain-like cysteine peptidase [Pseudomonas guariconensis]|uniref:DUF1796 family putative cysteine peptidase n=1 Tax=Pseudomonas guariconensis TaxID=1288410 RepID=UPI00209B11ED|nr:DUF1796 family putative cysteine peptidase [Pseudomonas guariconensis]MCO7630559.1 papain-like cysteine peptidase [Pseudomonas guariconensis]
MNNLNLPLGEYDFVSSLGRKCQPAGRLDMRGLRTVSGPFDWFASQKLPQVSKIINRGTGHLFLKENLKINGTFKNCMDVTDTLSGYRTIHDLPIKDCENGLDSAIAAMMSKINTRYNRFMSLVRNSERVLFVRLNAEQESTRKLRAILDKKFPNTHIDILIIKEEEGSILKNENWDIPNTFVVKETPNKLLIIRKWTAWERRKARFQTLIIG